MLGMSDGNTSIVVCLAIIAVWSLLATVLHNRRTVTRQELHGTVTYMIKGYDGNRAREIADALMQPGEASNVVQLRKPDELEHR
jgi:hypothetical protein